MKDNDLAPVILANSQIRQQFGVFLESRMRHAAITPSKLAERAHLSERTLRIYLKGNSDTEIRHDTYNKLLSASDTTHAEFLDYLQRRGISIDKMDVQQNESHIKDNSVSTSGVTIHGDVKVKGDAIGVLNGNVTFNK